MYKKTTSAEEITLDIQKGNVTSLLSTMPQGTALEKFPTFN